MPAAPPQGGFSELVQAAYDFTGVLDSRSVSMKTVSLIFGTHNNLPRGTDEESCERTYQQALKPFLTLLYKHSNFKVTLSYSGLLLEWLQERHPEFLMLVDDMMQRGQVELLGGAYYDPILPMIPANDRSGQIELLTTYIRKRFGKRPRGMWLAHKVWEPAMASTVKNCGMDYLFLDELHFATAGLRGSELATPCLTEDQGKTLVVIPVSASIQLFPFSDDPSAVVKQVESCATENGTSVVSLIADGREFGYWADSNERLFEQQWLARFLTALGEKDGRIVSTLPSAVAKGTAPLRRYYFGCSAPEEITSRALPVEQALLLDRLRSGRISRSGKAFLAGGYFRQFLTRYNEANMMYAKLMHVHILVNQIRGDKYRKRAAREELWKGEGNEAYWHDRSGGIYQSSLRRAVYRSLIHAEKATREKGVFQPHISSEDYDMDGLDEFLCKGNEVNMFIHRRGGTVFELDYLPASWNYLDTVTRQKETYHDRKEKGFVVDRYPRRSFVDHFFLPGEKLESFYAMNYREQGNLLSTIYEVESYKRDQMELALKASCTVGKFNLAFQKLFTLAGKSLSVRYVVRNGTNARASLCFGSEVNLAFCSPHSDDLQLMLPGSDSRKTIGPGPSAHRQVDTMGIKDLHNGVDIDMSLGLPADFWCLPVEACWWSPSGFVSGYQFSCFVPRWSFEIGPEEEWSTTVKVDFRSS